MHAEIRRRHVARYDAAVDELPGIEPLGRDPRDRHALHLYVVRIDPALAGADRDSYQRAVTLMRSAATRFLAWQCGQTTCMRSSMANPSARPRIYGWDQPEQDRFRYCGADTAAQILRRTWILYGAT